MTDQNAISINIQIDAPYVTKEEYSRRTGLPIGTINDYLKQGKLPIKRRSSSNEKVFINMIALMKEAVLNN
ncbi:hypothetical protein ACLSYX_10235 [[Pasteurella] aerogenes]